jgi:MFS family permease
VALLQRPGAARFCVSAMIGRAPMSMFGLGTVLLLTASTGRYGLAGLVSGAGSVGYAATAPQIARLADRFGQHRVLRPQIAFFAAACIAFVSCAEIRAPLWILMITGCLAGSSMPSLGSMVRARWSALLTEPDALQSAFALESVIDELLFVIGPALVTLLSTAIPPAGIIVCVVLAVAGTLYFAAQRETEPRQTMLASTAAAPPDEPTSAERTSGRLRLRRRRLSTPGLSVMVPLYFFVGTMFASIDLSTVDFAQRQGHKPLAGLILGTYALGSGIGGLWYGSRNWRFRLERRFALTLALTVAGVATFWAQPSLLSLDAGMLVAGLTIAPTMVAGYGIIQRQARPARRTEAMTWLSSAISVGVATGSAACGH